MISLAALTLDAIAAGASVPPERWDEIPPFQWQVYWDELSRVCPSKIEPRPVRQRNALRVEVLPDAGPRCSRLSPDDRGLAWLLSGGDPLAYGACQPASCPRAQEHRDPDPRLGNVGR